VTTTAVALTSGSPRLAFVVALDGYPHLLTNADQALVQAAWAATDWATATVIPNLELELDNQQTLHPWQPFMGGGTLRLRIAPDATDQLGVDIARSDAGVQTMLAATANRTTSAIAVGSTDNFTSLELHLGSECFSYKLASGGAFQIFGSHEYIPKRGKYTAFSAYSRQPSVTGQSNSQAFAEHHRVTTADNGVRLAPIVSEQPRTWEGRRIHLFLHVYEGTGALNTKSEALCIFSGFLDQPSDTATGQTEMFCTHLLDRIKGMSLGRDFFECTVGGGHYLSAGLTFQFVDYDGASVRTANVLTVVASGATGTNQINAGQYGIEEIAAFINAWLAGEKTASRIAGHYTLNCPEDVNTVPRTVMHFYVPTGTGNPVSIYWRLTWPHASWASILGFEGQVAWQVVDTAAAGHVAISYGSPQPITVFGTEAGGLNAGFDDSVGTFQDNYATLPAAIKAVLPKNGGGYQWGLFLFEIETPTLCVARIENNNTFRGILTVKSPVAPSPGAAFDDLSTLQVKVGEQPPRVRQIFLHEGRFRDVYRWLAYSTGTKYYNHPTHDLLPYGQGLAIPYEQLGQNFEDSLDALPGANDTILVCIDKPRKFEDISAADIKLRCAHLVWRAGGLRFVQWSTPSAALATTTLDETTKAELASNDQRDYRSPAVLDGTWVRNICKLQYDRDITKIAEGDASTYRSPPLQIEDATSVDDRSGQATVQTLDCVNVYSDYDGHGQGIKALAEKFAAWMPYWSRPIRKVHRSLALPYYETLGVGDLVLITDPFVRDPTTGARGTTARPALIIRHRYKISAPAAPQKMMLAGEIDVVFLGSDRTYAYAPAAETDFSATNNGLISNSVVQFLPHEHSDSGDPVDVTAFTTGDFVQFIEADPTNTSSPLNFGATVQSVSAGANQITFLENLSLSWTAGIRYRMTYPGYDSLASQQKSKSFQALGTGLVSNSPRTYGSLYGANTSPLNVASNFRRGATPNHLQVPELPSTGAYTTLIGGGGPPRDTGYDKELATLLDNMMDHKSNRSTPFLSNVESANTDYDGWKLLRVRPIFMGFMLLGGNWNRWMYIRPLLRYTGLSVVTPLLRVTLTGKLPQGSSRNGNYLIKAPAVSNTWVISKADTSYHIGDEAAFPLINFNYYQYAFLVIEGNLSAATKGLAQAVERERVAL
jgi:hypothetical protein